jgi:hypothetical protein
MPKTSTNKLRSQAANENNKERKKQAFSKRCRGRCQKASTPKRQKKKASILQPIQIRSFSSNISRANRKPRQAGQPWEQAITIIVLPVVLLMLKGTVVTKNLGERKQTERPSVFSPSPSSQSPRSLHETSLPPITFLTSFTKPYSSYPRPSPKKKRLPRLSHPPISP